ncbi:uncharacterized protein FOMMEDRAFT_31122 [Fomitiporia mediterranea MF3/22]|uniref:uncharacterized protein n=1 Tax=Fomitiporia mediterranea (strain MF3/22) TaxID=694068 RepID=UPI000440997D|nr:uncharacterized protein FOMMEDRAFT_31122 [Fomitiporia mediterranea MF3/22]EJC99897.1 hypothetical protein FOMMEDRAFT_31122 [Fomitiporia mediterranea MF3/22]
MPMAFRLFDLPIELRYHVAVSIVPPNALRNDSELDSLQGSGDELESIQSRFRDLKNFSLVCRATWELCREIVRQGVELIGDKTHTRYLRKLEDGSLPDFIQNTSKIKFLSFGGIVTHNDEEHGCDHYCSELQEQDNRIRRILAHFPYITTLHLVNVPLSILTVQSLIPMGSLRTLIIIDPDPNSHERYHNAVLRRCQNEWDLPPVTTLSIVASESNSCGSVSNFITLFEKSITSLSIRSEQDKLEIPHCKDSLRYDLFLDNAYCIKLSNLKHLSIGYLKFTSLSLREFLDECESLESLSVDCQGSTEESLPMVYILELLGSLAGDDDLMFNLLEYDWKHDGFEPPPYIDSPYMREDKIMLSSVIHFSCRLFRGRPSAPKRKIVERLQLTFSRNNEEARVIDSTHLLYLVRRRTPALNGLNAQSFTAINEGLA